MKRKPTTDVAELQEEALVIVSNELRKLREQSGKSDVPDSDVAGTVGDLLRVLTYVKRNRDADQQEEVGQLTTEEIKEKLLQQLDIEGKQVARAQKRQK